MMETHYPFTLPPLPFAYDALAPELDEKTMHFHHDKHFAAYVDNLNKLLSDRPEYQGWSLEKLCQDWPELPEDIRQGVRNNAGGVYNHDLYFKTLAPTPATAPDGELEGAVIREFGDLTKLKAAMKAAALGQFGSGWAWLVSDCDGKLSIQKTPQHAHPPAPVPPAVLDVWSTLLSHQQQRRADYFDAWWLLVDWPSCPGPMGTSWARRPRCPHP